MTHDHISIFLYGLTGKMGREISALAAEDSSFRVVGGSSRTSPSPLLPCAVAIDFSSPTSLNANLKEAIEHHIPLLVGTTGLTEEHFSHLEIASKQIPILQTANTSIGITVLNELVNKAAQLLNDTYDIEIVEAHHRHKVDAPSGTALSFGKAAALGRGKSPSNDANLSLDRKGLREKGSIGFSVQRGGGVFGEHTIRFMGDEEVVELTHRCLSRKLFARGALQAAQWLSHQPPGLYSMNHVLNLV